MKITKRRQLQRDMMIEMMNLFLKDEVEEMAIEMIKADGAKSLSGIFYVKYTARKKN